MSVELLAIIGVLAILFASVVYTYSAKIIKPLLISVVIGSIAGTALWGLLDMHSLAKAFDAEQKLYVLVEDVPVAAFVGKENKYSTPKEPLVQIQTHLQSRDFTTLGKTYYKIVVMRPSLFEKVKTVRFGEDVFSKEDVLGVLKSPVAKLAYAQLIMQRRSVKNEEQLLLAINTAFPTHEALKSSLLVVLYNSALVSSSLLEEVNKGTIDVHPSSLTFFYAERAPARFVRGDWLGIAG